MSKHVLSRSTNGQPIPVSLIPVSIHQQGLGIPPGTTECMTLYASNPNSIDDVIALIWDNGLMTHHPVGCGETIPIIDNIPLQDGGILGAVALNPHSGVQILHVVGFVERF